MWIVSPAWAIAAAALGRTRVLPGPTSSTRPVAVGQSYAPAVGGGAGVTAGGGAAVTGGGVEVAGGGAAVAGGGVGAPTGTTAVASVDGLDPPHAGIARTQNKAKLDRTIPDRPE